MPPFRITLAYDGTDFSGWQRQAEGAPSPARTVQGVLEAALGRLANGSRVAVAGAGRTDTGVHAVGQVASFELDRDLPAEALQRALNALLPADVRVLAASVAPSGFHARKSARSKHYRYLLDTAAAQLPTRRRLAGHRPGPLDHEAVRQAAALYLGRHDFASVASSGSSVKTSVRTITRSEVAFEEDTMVYDVEADGFLRKMVRSLVGGLVAAGRGALTVDALQAALAARDRARWPPPAPACGLTLIRVDYPPEAALT
jgi:tRNA pseudouridine38-40 synthase